MRATAEDRPALNVIEQGGHCNAVEEGWGMNAASGLPDVTDVAVDSADNVYLFCRGDEPVRVFDRGGRMLRSFGRSVRATARAARRPRRHALLHRRGQSLGSDADAPWRRPRTHRRSGTGAFMSGEPFNRCTNVAIGPAGDIYVADGYGNARVHRYSHSGKLLMSWGEPGVAPGQFNIVHDICCDRAGHTRTVWSRVYEGPPPAEVRTLGKLRRQ